MEKHDEDWVVVYGYGTRSAFVVSFPNTRVVTEHALTSRHKTWAGGAAARFSMHPWNETVLGETVRGDLRLTPQALGARRD